MPKIGQKTCPCVWHSRQIESRSFLIRFEVDRIESKGVIEALFASRSYYPNLRTYKGGISKICIIVSGWYIAGRTFQDNGALVSWISAANDVFAKYYIKPRKPGAHQCTEPSDKPSCNFEIHDTEALKKAFEDALSSNSSACLGHPAIENSPSHHMDGEGSTSQTKREDAFARP